MLDILNCFYIGEINFKRRYLILSSMELFQSNSIKESSSINREKVGWKYWYCPCLLIQMWTETEVRNPKVHNQNLSLVTHIRIYIPSRFSESFLLKTKPRVWQICLTFSTYFFMRNHPLLTRWCHRLLDTLYAMAKYYSNVIACFIFNSLFVLLKKKWIIYNSIK